MTDPRPVSLRPAELMDRLEAVEEEIATFRAALDGLVAAAGIALDARDAHGATLPIALFSAMEPLRHALATAKETP